MMRLDLINNKVVSEENHIFWHDKRSTDKDIRFGGIVKKKDLKSHFNKLDSFIKSKADQSAYNYLEGL